MPRRVTLPQRQYVEVQRVDYGRIDPGTGRATRWTETQDVTFGDNRSTHCSCGCGETVNYGRRFRQGHDARLRGRILAYARQGGALEHGEAMDALRRFGWERFLSENVYHPARNGRTSSVRRQRLARTGRTFGVELEVTGISRQAAAQALSGAGIRCVSETYNHRTRTYWKVVPDASVSGGTEVVSPILQGEDGFDQLQRAMKALRDAGARVDSTCGTHVHHGASDLTRDQLAAMVEFWSHRHDNFAAFVPRSRRASRWCLPLSASEVRTVTQGFRTYGTPGSVDRYRALNTLSYPRYGTIEIRMHQGTLNYTKLSHWIRLVQAAFEAVVSGRTVRTDLGGMLADLDMSDAHRTWLVNRVRTLGTSVPTQEFELRHAAALAEMEGPVSVDMPPVAVSVEAAPVDETPVVVDGHHRAAAQAAVAEPRVRTTTFGETVYASAREAERAHPDGYFMFDPNLEGWVLVSQQPVEAGA